MLITLREVIDTRAHVGDYAKSKLLRVLALAMMLAGEGYETFGQTYKSDAECTLIDDALYGIGRSEILGTVPQTRHEQRELLGHSGLLEVESLAQLTGCNLKDVIKFAEESCHTLLAIENVHTLDGKTHDINCGEADVAAAYRSLFAKTVFEDSCAASHCRDD